jgi:antirestriction protein
MRPTNRDYTDLILLDTIDSRDILARIDALENTTDPDDLAELTILESVAEESAGYAEDWIHGETLIRDSYFPTYARELADDIGALPDDAAWPHTCIDWEKAARELQMDYTAVDFAGVTYWIR